MKYFNETLRNWLLGKSEIDQLRTAIPPVEKSPHEIVELFKKTGEMIKINEKLKDLGYEAKVVLYKKK